MNMCSFCGKNKAECVSETLIHGQSAFICFTCVEEATTLLSQPDVRSIIPLYDYKWVTERRTT